MTVSITWSLANGGAAITALDHGAADSGNTLTAQEIYIEHDAINALTQCSFHLSGDAINVAEAIGWGDASASDDFGGFQINMRATESPAYDNWPTFADKSPAGLDTHTFRTNFGDTSANGITLAKSMGAINDGIIQAGNSPNIRFQLRIVLPSSLSLSGSRTIDQKLRFTFTS